MNFKAFLLSAAVFAPLVFASSAPSNFDAFVPKNEKASAEYKQTVTAVTGKMDSITACGASSADFEGFKTCVAKLNLPQLLVDNFPADSYKDAKAVEVAMNAYSAALTKKIDRKIIQKAEEHEENTEATSISTDKDEKTALSAVLLYGNMAFWFLLYAGVSVLFVVGFFLIVYTYFVRKTEAVDL